MLPWLAPLSLATAGVGLLLYCGRGLVAGMAVALAWTLLGVAAAPASAVAGGLLAYAIFTGRTLIDRRHGLGR
jgi:hypothetical protein